MALVENIQREDLNAIEIALGMQRLIDECNLTQEALSEKVGKKRSTVSNYMRLLKLPNEVQLALKEGLISMGHAKAIAGAPEELQLRLLKKCIRKGLSVRQIEELVRALAADNQVASVVGAFDRDGLRASCTSLGSFTLHRKIREKRRFRRNPQQ